MCVCGTPTRRFDFRVLSVEATNLLEAACRPQLWRILEASWDSLAGFSRELV